MMRSLPADMRQALEGTRQELRTAAQVRQPWQTCAIGGVWFSDRVAEDGRYPVLHLRGVDDSAGDGQWGYSMATFTMAPTPPNDPPTTAVSARFDAVYGSIVRELVEWGKRLVALSDNEEVDPQEWDDVYNRALIEVHWIAAAPRLILGPGLDANGKPKRLKASAVKERLRLFESGNYESLVAKYCSPACSSDNNFSASRVDEQQAAEEGSRAARERRAVLAASCGRPGKGYQYATSRPPAYLTDEREQHLAAKQPQRSQHERELLTGSLKRVITKCRADAAAREASSGGARQTRGNVSDSPDPMTTEVPEIEITEEALFRTLYQMDPTASNPVDGLSTWMLRAMFPRSEKVRPRGPDSTAARITELANLYATGELPQEFYALLNGASLIALFKNQHKRDGREDLRPIAMTSRLRVLFVRTAQAGFVADLRTAVEPEQLAAHTRNGTEKLIDSLKFQLDLPGHEDWVVISLDMVNAFNTCSRPDIINALWSNPDLRPLVRLAYAGLAPEAELAVTVNGERQIAQFLSSCGVQQGAPDASAQYNILADRLYKHITQALDGEGVCHAICDDGYVAGPASKVFPLMTKVFGSHGQPGLAELYTGCKPHLGKLWYYSRHGNLESWSDVEGTYPWREAVDQGVVIQEYVPKIDDVAHEEWRGAGFIAGGVPMSADCERGHQFVQWIMERKLDKLEREFQRAEDTFKDSTNKQTLWSLTFFSMRSQLNHWRNNVDKSDMREASKRFDRLVDRIQERLCGLEEGTLNRPHNERGRPEWLPEPRRAEENEDEADARQLCDFEHHVLRMRMCLPPRLGGLGCRSSRDNLPVAWLSSRLQSLPSLVNARVRGGGTRLGLCPGNQVEDALGAHSFDHNKVWEDGQGPWSALLASNTRFSRMFREAWSEMQEMAGFPQTGPLAEPVYRAGMSISHKAQKLFSTQIEDTWHASLLAQVRAQSEIWPKSPILTTFLRHPVGIGGSSWVTALPSKRFRLSNLELEEAIARTLGTPSPALRNLKRKLRHQELFIPTTDGGLTTTTITDHLDNLINNPSAAGAWKSAHNLARDEFARLMSSVIGATVTKEVLHWLVGDVRPKYCIDMAVGPIPQLDEEGDPVLMHSEPMAVEFKRIQTVTFADDDVHQGDGVDRWYNPVQNRRNDYGPNTAGAPADRYAQARLGELINRYVKADEDRNDGLSTHRDAFKDLGLVMMVFGAFGELSSDARLLVKRLAAVAAQDHPMKYNQSTVARARALYENFIKRCLSTISSRAYGRVVEDRLRAVERAYYNQAEPIGSSSRSRGAMARQLFNGQGGLEAAQDEELLLGASGFGRLASAQEVQNERQQAVCAVAESIVQDDTMYPEHQTGQPDHVSDSSVSPEPEPWQAAPAAMWEQPESITSSPAPSDESYGPVAIRSEPRTTGVGAHPLALTLNQWGIAPGSERHQKVRPTLSVRVDDGSDRTTLLLWFSETASSNVRWARSQLASRSECRPAQVSVWLAQGVHGPDSWSAAAWSHLPRHPSKYMLVAPSGAAIIIPSATEATRQSVSELLTPVAWTAHGFGHSAPWGFDYGSANPQAATTYEQHEDGQWHWEHRWWGVDLATAQLSEDRGDGSARVDSAQESNSHDDVRVAGSRSAGLQRFNFPTSGEGHGNAGRQRAPNMASCRCAPTSRANTGAAERAINAGATRRHNHARQLPARVTVAAAPTTAPAGAGALSQSPGCTGAPAGASTGRLTISHIYCPLMFQALQEAEGSVPDQFAAIPLIADTWSTMVVLMRDAIDAARMRVALHTAFATSSDGHISADTQDAVMRHSDCPTDLLHATAAAQVALMGAERFEAAMFASAGRPVPQP